MMTLENFTQSYKKNTIKNYAVSLFMSIVMMHGLIPVGQYSTMITQPNVPEAQRDISLSIVEKSRKVLTGLHIAKNHNRKSLIGNPTLARKFAKTKIGNGKQYQCLLHLWNSESNWRTLAKNKYSGAYGIPQSLPGDKMASVGKDWKYSYKTQVRWGLKYIKLRYETPCSAWSFKQREGWY